MSLWQRVVDANRPGPPEHSVRFRAATTAAVAVAIAACHAQGELSAPVAAGALLATVVGNVLSYRTRERPWPAVKPLLAVCVLAGFGWFLLTVTRTATPGDVASVEAPLATLFCWVLGTHAFDVPSRRDVAYSLAGSAALMAVAAAQSVDVAFAGFVALWAGCVLVGLVSMWQSMASVTGAPWGLLGGSVLTTGVVALGLLVALPAPHVSASLAFPSSSGGDAPVTSPSHLTDGSPSRPARAASPSGRLGVGGYLGFARSLDTADRVALGNRLVLRVRASRPGYWVGQTYDTWNGRSWSETGPGGVGGSVRVLGGGSPYAVPVAEDALAPLAANPTDVETFYLAESGPNLVFHTENATRVYIDTPRLFLAGDGTIVSASSMGAGTVYTVVSQDVTATAAQLRAAGTGSSLAATSLTPAERARYLQLPRPYRRAAALAQQVAGGRDPYDAVAALERWMTTHVRYSTDIPPLPAGADAVDSFLFGARVGYCEQISTALTVMLRTLGIPAREAVGYVPGSYNPVTDLYDVRAKDAHAWVQVWFPGYGWQSFDPTADVPLANPSPGAVLVDGLGHLAGRLPWAPIGGAIAVVVMGLAAVRVVRARPPTWAHRVVSDLERAGHRALVPRGTGETLAAFARRLAEALGPPGAGLPAAVRTVERAAFGGHAPGPDEVAAATAAARAARRGARRAVTPGRGRALRRRRPGLRPGGGAA